MAKFSQENVRPNENEKSPVLLIILAACRVCHVTHFGVRFSDCVTFDSLKFKVETVPGYKLNNHLV